MPPPGWRRHRGGLSAVAAARSRRRLASRSEARLPVSSWPPAGGAGPTVGRHMAPGRPQTTPLDSITCSANFKKAHCRENEAAGWFTVTSGEADPNEGTHLREAGRRRQCKSLMTVGGPAPHARLRALPGWHGVQSQRAVQSGSSSDWHTLLNAFFCRCRCTSSSKRVSCSSCAMHNVLRHCLLGGATDTQQAPPSNIPCQHQQPHGFR